MAKQQCRLAFFICHLHYWNNLIRKKWKKEQENFHSLHFFILSRAFLFRLFLAAPFIPKERMKMKMMGKGKYRESLNRKLHPLSTSGGKTIKKNFMLHELFSFFWEDLIRIYCTWDAQAVSFNFLLKNCWHFLLSDSFRTKFEFFSFLFPETKDKIRKKPKKWNETAELPSSDKKDFPIVS